jgi:hypothetical protein
MKESDAWLTTTLVSATVKGCGAILLLLAYVSSSYGLAYDDDNRH